MTDIWWHKRAHHCSERLTEQGRHRPVSLMSPPPQHANARHTRTEDTTCMDMGHCNVAFGGLREMLFFFFFFFFGAGYPRPNSEAFSSDDGGIYG